MQTDISFHCDIDYNFRFPEEQVRAFPYHDYAICLHTHSFYEINIVLSGRGVHQIMGTSLPVKAGAVFIIPPMIPHAYYDTENMDVFHILVRPEVIQKELKDACCVEGFLLFTEIEPYLRAASYTSPFLQLQQKDLMMLQDDLDLLRDDHPFNKPGNEAFRLHLLWKILYTCSILLSRQTADDTKKRAKYEQQILDALEYIHRNYASPISTEDLYKRAFLSRSTFLRSFHTMCGCSPMQYLAQYRKKKALEMLEDPLVTKTQVAQACGFYDLSHLRKTLEGKK